jgi:primase-polymerase (primpol)-like protein
MHDNVVRRPPQSETRYPYCNAGQWAYEAIHSVGNVIFLGRQYVRRKVSWLKPENFDPVTSAIPYGLDDLAAANAAGQTVIIAENEPTVELIRNLGFIATCFADSIWLPVYGQYFRNTDVVIMTRFWVERIASGLAPAARRVRIAPPPETIGSKEELARLVAAAALYAAQPESFGLKLSRPKVVTIKHGPRCGQQSTVCSGKPTKAFEDALEHAYNGKIHGYTVDKHRGQRQVSFWQDPPSDPRESKPVPIPPNFNNIPAELAERPNWVLWRYEPPKRPGKKKWEKVPYQPDGTMSDNTDPKQWHPFAAVCAVYAQGGYDGIGFVFDGVTGADGLCIAGIDFDHCIAGNDDIDPLVKDRVNTINSYCELSPGGDGLHILGYAEPLKRIVNYDGVEMYTKSRYFTFTGQGNGTIRAIAKEFAALAKEVWAKQAADKKEENNNKPKTRDDKYDAKHWYNYLQPEQQDEVVDYALGIIATETTMLELEADGGNNLDWYRMVTAAARSGAPHAEDIFVKYASQAKSADGEDAIRQKFTTCRDSAPDCEGITVGTLLGLARDNGGDFGLWRVQGEQARRAAQIAENIKIGDDVTEPLLPEIMTLEEMHDRLVFIGSTGGVADRITGRVRTKDTAAQEYAASMHTYEVNGKEKTASALPLWIASPGRLSVEVLTWFPGRPQICQPPEGPGPAFNTWRGLPPLAYPEDWQTHVEPFLEHVAYLVPVEEERERFLQWLAHIFQKPEVLPHTAYLMTTPTTGTGRNLLASILVRALRGFVAAGLSMPELLDGAGFTGRLSKKLLLIFDEAREGGGEGRYKRQLRLTSMLNQEHRHINPKYGHESIEKNCARWLMFSNFDDAIPFDNADRRVIVIANPTVRKEDTYYERLYGLLNDSAFIGSVRRYLETKDIDGFRPGEHAPMNEAKQRVLNSMMSETERAVAEFKEACKTELTSRGTIRAFINENNYYEGSQYRREADPTETHLTHAIRRAGMVSTGRRITAYKMEGCPEAGGKTRFSVVIMHKDGGWTHDLVKNADAGKLLEAMGLTDWTAVKPPPVTTGFKANGPLPQDAPQQWVALRQTRGKGRSSNRRRSCSPTC